MASGTAYSGWSANWKPSGSSVNKRFRTWLQWSTTDYATYTAVSASMGIELSSSVKATFTTNTLDCTGQTQVSAGSQTTVFKSSGGQLWWTWITTRTWNISRGTADKTINLKAFVQSSSASWNEHCTASVNVTVPHLQTYSVTYNANGGSGAPAAQTKYYGITLKLQTGVPTKSGYTFLGWNTSSSATSASYAAGGSYTGNANLALYAIWRKTLTLSYNANNGTGAPAAQSANVYNGTTSSGFTISATKPTRTGYTFKGWSTSSTATTPSYQPSGSITISSNTTLHAVWQINTWTVSYNANTGEGAPASQTKTYGVDLTLSSTVPTKKGYAFRGWATSQTATTVEYSAGGTYSANNGAVLYAVWEQTYFAPTIGMNPSAKRATWNGTAYEDDEEGHVAHVTFSWEKGLNEGVDVVPDHAYIGISVQGADDYTYTEITLTTGTTDVFVTNPNLLDINVYDVIIKFEIDGWDDVTRTTFISAAYYIMDINPTGTAVGIGGVVNDNETVCRVYMPLEAMDDIVLKIDDSASAGTVDGDLYNALYAVGWID